MKLLWNEVSQYRLDFLAYEGKFTKDKPLTVLDDSKQDFTLFMKGHPMADLLLNNTGKFPVKLIKANTYSFFAALPTYMADISKVGILGTSESSLVDEDGIAPVKWKIYDYDRDPYKDPDMRGRFSIRAHVPLVPEDYVVTEDGYGALIDSVFVLGSTVRVNYTSDLYYATPMDIPCSKIVLVKNSSLDKLV